MAPQKTSQLLFYIIKNHTDISITSLMKLSYLIDLVSIKKTGKKISDFEYIRYNYGPFDKKIYKCLEGLIANNRIKEGSNISSTGDEFITYSIHSKSSYPLEKISEEEIEIINEVLENLEGYGPKALTELTYKTKPMKKIKATLNNKAGLNKILNLES